MWPTVGCLVVGGIAFALLALSISHGMRIHRLCAVVIIGTAAIVLVAVLFLGSRRYL